MRTASGGAIPARGRRRSGPQSETASTRRRAASAWRRPASGSARSLLTSCAKDAASVAIAISAPGSRSRPSAPTGVETTGTPQAAASRIFRRVPPPAWSGTIETAAPCQCGRVSPPSPRSRKSCAAPARRSAGAPRPRISDARLGPPLPHERPDPVAEPAQPFGVGRPGEVSDEEDDRIGRRARAEAVAARGRRRWGRRGVAPRGPSPRASGRRGRRRRRSRRRRTPGAARGPRRAEPDRGQRSA